MTAMAGASSDAVAVLTIGILMGFPPKEMAQLVQILDTQAFSDQAICAKCHD
jgi:hypothetical protein